MQLNCAWCANPFEKPVGEVNRQIKKGRQWFFCSLSCGAKHNNDQRGDKNRPIEKQCPECHKHFVSHTGAKAATFCSRSCASAGSVTDKRSEQAKIFGRQNLPSTIEHLSKMMRQREAWRYVKVNTYLNHMKIPHEFEFVVGNFLFDLALPEHGVLIEFDEAYHNGLVQSTKDLEKDRYAEDNKWIVIRVPAQQATVIEPESIYAIIEQFVLS